MARHVTPSAPAARALAATAAAMPVQSVRLVDSRRAEALTRLGITSAGDLARHFPFRYLDLTDVADMRAVRPGSDATVVGRVHDIKIKHPRPRLTITEIALVDGTGAVIGVWFNQPYIAQRFRIGERVAFAGSVVLEYGLKQIKTPFTEKLDDDTPIGTLGRVLPVHRAVEGLSTNWVRRLVDEALELCGDQPDHLPAGLRAARDLVPVASALSMIQHPMSMADVGVARRRLAYDELLAIQIAMAMRRHRVVDARAGVAHLVRGRAWTSLVAALPFPLTADQERAIEEIGRDMERPHPMNRLLLGDVGTGKTAVAAHALAACADSGTQAAMMAPTEVLAQQYARAVGPLLDAAGVSWALLTGSTKGAERARIIDGLRDGTLTVAFGTHALIQRGVTFANLSLAIVDEQHRFGVGQRLALRAKGEAMDMLVMTATPIPRSLALTVYGDLATSYLRERPGGRGDTHVTTEIVHRSTRPDAYQAVRDAVARGERAYVVCALVEETDTTEARAAVTEARRLQRDVFPGLRVGLLTGAMSAADKSAAMEHFRSGEIDVLVATTVVEVGVDVPEATVLIIENAERFGLAQLHQLRGRVGRGERPGRVLLFADPKTEEGRARMEAIATVTDGFELAERDLALRGEGEVLGERQSGLPALRVASLARDVDLIEIAREDAVAIIARDPALTSPVHGPLCEWVRRVIGDAWEWVSSG